MTKSMIIYSSAVAVRSRGSGRINKFATVLQAPTAVITLVSEKRCARRIDIIKLLESSTITLRSFTQILTYGSLATPSAALSAL
jgi:hypothetical protein